MKKNIIIILFFILSSASVFGQGGVWTWMHGGQTPAYLGNYGIKGVAAPSNAPPARYRPAFWKDKDGKFWLFGGQDFAGSAAFNDLWKFDPKTNEWTWMHGPQYGTNMAGSSGLKGISAPTNLPSAFGLPSSWTGEDGYLYLYGASRFGDDMWRYDIATNEWTWIAGDANSFLIIKADHGTKGVAAPSNTPGKRELAAKSAWVYDNKLWLFGGQAYVANTVLPASDLWAFDLTTNLWTWVSGGNTPPYNGNYGTQNVPSVNNIPPGRWALCNWMKDDKFYLFGGWGRSDFWEYNLISNEWEWVGGSQIRNQSGYVTQKCLEDNQFIPHGKRLEGQFAQRDNCASLHWLFGGVSVGVQDDYNDLWVFNSDNDTWNLVWGNNGLSIPMSFGTLGVPAPSNAPPGRDGAAMWVDNDNNLWIFGGVHNSNYDTYGDMWKFTLDTNCVKPKKMADSLWSKDLSICPNDSVLIDFSPGTEVSVSPSTGAVYNKNSGKLYLFPSTTQVYEVVIPAPSCGKGQIGTVTVQIDHIEPKALFELRPRVTTLNNPSFSTFNSSTDANQYQWYINNSFYANQKDLKRSFGEPGEYCFTLVAQNNCLRRDTLTKCGTIETDIYIPSAFSPNADGNNDILKIISSRPVDLQNFSIYNRWGQRVFVTNDWQQGWDGNYKGVRAEIGVYFYLIDYKLAGLERQLRGDVTLIR